MDKKKIEKLAKRFVEAAEKMSEELVSIIEDCNNNEDKYMPEFGELCEVSSSTIFPKFPCTRNFFSFNESGKFIAMDNQGEKGITWHHYRKIKQKPKYGITFYIARDTNGYLWAYIEKPLRPSTRHAWSLVNDLAGIRLPSEKLPHVKSTDLEPFEITI